MEKYVAKTNILEVIQYTGNNLEEVENFIAGNDLEYPYFSYNVEIRYEKTYDNSKHMFIYYYDEGGYLKHDVCYRLYPGDYIARDWEGKSYVIGKNRFEKAYIKYK